MSDGDVSRALVSGVARFRVTAHGDVRFDVVEFPDGRAFWLNS